MRQKKLLAALVVSPAVAAAAGGFFLLPHEPSAVPGAAASATQAEAPSAERPIAALPARELPGEPRGILMVTPAPEPARPVAAEAPVRPVKPAAPPMPYRVAGRLFDVSGGDVLLAKGDRVLAVRVGDILEDLYRVESIRSDAVTLVYLPLGTPENLPIAPLLVTPPSAAPGAEASTTPAAGSPTAARMRWEGPASVQDGETFDVALKLTSAQAVRSLPLQLSFDAKVLEPVGARAGSFFGDGGNLDYRISPNGSILVGPSDTLATGSDADFIVLTFRPIRGAATAELSVTSVTLRDADGRAVALERPPAFRLPIE